VKNYMVEHEMNKDEQIGFHKGSLNTLSAERAELLKIVNITEQLMNMHIKELEKLGVNISTSTPKNDKNIP